jgi:alpha-1,2-mannosyltransferase
MFGICVALAKTCLGLLTDCDEVYNYWEVLHLFTHGYGLQTWEYSYKLRSISYIWLKYLFFLLYEHVSFVLDFSVLDFSAPDLLRSSVLPSQKTLFFYSTKALLALSAWYTHRYLYQYLLKKNKIIAKYTYLFTLLSPGFFHSDIAFLPSSFSMLFVTLAFATQGPIYVLLMAIATLWGWPFCALLGLPRLLYLVFTHRFGFKFLRMAMLSLCFALPILAIDYYYYGELFFAPWNIVAYNIFGIGPNGTLLLFSFWYRAMVLLLCQPFFEL